MGSLAGAHGLKLFPGEMITPAVVKALRAVLPVGGVNPGNMGAYLAAGADEFGMGSALFKPGMGGGGGGWECVEVGGCVEFWLSF